MRFLLYFFKVQYVLTVGKAKPAVVVGWALQKQDSTEICYIPLTLPIRQHAL
jgi:hypothetical protein